MGLQPYFNQNMLHLLDSYEVCWAMLDIKVIEVSQLPRDYFYDHFILLSRRLPFY